VGSEEIISENLKVVRRFVRAGGHGVFLDFSAIVGYISGCHHCHSAHMAVPPVHLTVVVIHRIIFHFVDWT
jgi:hypothetical protein